MVNKKNNMFDQRPHFGLRKLSVGVVSVLLSTTFFMGAQSQAAHADSTSGNTTSADTATVTTSDSGESNTATLSNVNASDDANTTATASDNNATTDTADSNDTAATTNTVDVSSLSNSSAIATPFVSLATTTEKDPRVDAGIINADTWGQTIANQSPTNESDGSYKLYSSVHDYTTTAFGNSAAANKGYTGYDLVQGNVYIRDISDEYVAAGGTLGPNEHRWEIDYGRSKTAQQGQGSYWASIMLSKGMSITGKINITMMSGLNPNNIQADAKNVLQIDPTTGPTLGPDGRDIKYDNVSSGTNSAGAKVFMADRSKYTPNGTANLQYNGSRFNSSNDARLEIWLSPNFASMSENQIIQYLTNKISTQQGYTKSYNSNRDANVFLFESSDSSKAANTEYFKDGSSKTNINAFDLGRSAGSTNYMWNTSNPNAAGNLGQAYAFHYAAAGGSNTDRIMTTMQFTTVSDGSATPHFLRAGFTADDANAYYISSANLNTITNYKVVVNETSDLTDQQIPQRSLTISTPDNKGNVQSLSSSTEKPVTSTFTYKSDTDTLLDDSNNFKLTVNPSGDTSTYKVQIATPVIDKDNHTITYNVRYVANKPTINVTAFDKTTNTSLEIPTNITTSYTGEPGTAVGDDFTTGIQSIKDYFTSKGYTYDESSTIPTNFGTDSSQDQTATLNFVHGTATLTPGTTLPGTVNESGTTPKFTQDDYDKTVTRTIVDADDPSTPLTTQSVEFGRTITYDKVTGQIDGSKSQPWSPATGTWDAYTPTKAKSTVVSVDNDSSKTTVDSEEVTPASSNKTVNVKFERNDQTVTVKIVDGSDNNTPLQEVTVSGKPGTSVDVPNYTDLIKSYTDKGYTVGTDGTTNGKVTVGEDDSDVTITLEHGTGTVKPGDDLPTGVNFTKDDYDKTVTRTIVDADDPSTPLTTQSVEFGRTITYDKVTGQIDGSKSQPWSPANGTWAAYTPTKDKSTVVSVDNDPTKTTVDSETVTPASSNKTVNVKFERNDQTVTVKIVDGSDNNTPLQEVTVSGKPGTSVDVPNYTDLIKSYTDKGYTVGTDGTTNGKVTVGEDDSDVTITLEHGTGTVKPGDDLPTGVNFTKEDYDKTVTRTIVDSANPTVPLETQSVQFGRTITYDKVTGQIDETKSQPWSPATGTWDAYTPTKENETVISVDGDTSKKSVEAENVTPASTNKTVTVDFTRNNQTVTVKIVDGDDNNQQLQSIPVSGKPGTSVDVPNYTDLIKSYTDKGYTVTNDGTTNGQVTVGESDSEVTITLGHGTGTLNPGDTIPATVNENGTTPQFTQDDYDKTVTRTIVDADDPSTPLTTQSVEFGRTITYDKVTGQIDEAKSQPWSPATGTWDAYTPTKDKSTVVSVDNDPAKTTVESETVTPASSNKTVNVKFERNDQTVTVKIVDGSDNNTPLQEVTVSGKPGTSVDVPNYTDLIKSYTDKGYTVGTDGTTNGKVTVGEDNSDVTITLEHGTGTLNPGDTIPATVNENGTTPQFTKDDYDKTVTRTIVDADNPDTPLTTQSVEFGRTITYDKVTGQIDETKSQPWSPATGTWEAYTPTKDKSTVVSVDNDPAKTTVESETVTPASSSKTVNVKFERNDQTVTVKIVDGSDNNNPLQEVTVTGKPGTSVDVPNYTDLIKSYTDKGYTVGTDGTTNGKVTVGEDDSDVTITLEHGTGTLNPGDTIPATVNENGTTPQFTKDDYDKTVTRTIIDADKPSTPLATQSVEFGRTITYDKVTGKIDESKSQPWSPASGTWDAYTPTKTNETVISIDGDTSKTTIDSQTVTPDSSNQTVTVNFTRNNQTVTVKVIDKDNGDEVLTTIPVTGKPGTSVDVPGLEDTIKTLTDKGYTVVSNGTTDGKVTVGDDDSEVTITVEHGTGTLKPGDTIPETVNDNGTKPQFTKDDFDKTVTRTIVDADNQDTPLTTQSVEFGRTITFDKVTGKINEDKSQPWSPESGTWDAYTPVKDKSHVTSVDNDPAKTTIEAEEVTPTSSNKTVNVKFERNNQTVTVKVVDKDDGNSVVTTIPVTGQPGTSIDVPGLEDTIKTLTDKGYTVVSNGTTDGKVTVGEDDSDVTITVEHGTGTLKPGDTIPESVNENGTTPQFTKDDYDKTVTRTIVDADNPDTPLTTQSVEFGRTITYDKVTGKINEDKSQPWSPANGTWDAYTPVKDKATVVSINNDPTKKTVESQTVTPATSSQTVNVKFERNNQTVTVKVIDKDNGDEVLTTIPVPGKPGTEVEVPGLEDTIKTLTDKGYTVVSNGTTDGKVTVGEEDSDITITVEHGTGTLKPGDEFPETINGNGTKPQFTKDDYDKTVTRTIVDANDPGTPLESQSVEFGRTITYDKVTGKIDEAKSGNWKNVTDKTENDSGTWAAYTPSKKNSTLISIDGDKTKTTVDAETVTKDTADKSVTVEFDRNNQTVTVKIIDKDNGDEVLTTIPVSGKPGTEVDVPGLGDTIKTLTDKGYTVVSNGTTDGKVTVGDDDSDVTITVEHGTATVKPGDELPTGVQFTKDDYDKNVKRTIVDNTDPASPKTIETQTVHFGRVVTYDKVTGKIIEGQSGKWTNLTNGTDSDTGNWPEFNLGRDGYTGKVNGEDISTIPAKDVTHDTPDETISVVFVENPATPAQPTKPADQTTAPASEDKVAEASTPATRPSAEKKTLPQTGNDSSKMAQVAGLLLTGLSMLGLGNKKRKED
ncbi:MAG: YSIRK-type signal peptide-containing protein [Limosilactobacillus sp.]|uniref:mucin-binding protein n=1 Tax=Limosilactobacillus sp. TaxID=2773925 RepID=UPI002700DB91|nr:YSIRK-type signal peptide-containing protein [Limosilactobacillus sp.]